MAIFKPKLKGFYELQPYHVQEILLVSSLYDAFIFEEDGQLTEKIFSEFTDFHLTYAPRITQVESAEKAMEFLKRKNYDMLITTLQLEVDVVEFCTKIKKDYPHISTVLLTHAPNRIPPMPKESLQKSFDGIFAWNGDTKIFLAIIKLIEDKLNAKHDTEIANVRVIVVVEDSIKNYSSFLPLLYFEIMAQTRALISNSLTRENKIFRMRTRPKVMLASDYEDAVKICDEYKDYLIGMISDVRFPRNGKTDPEAGFELIKKVKDEIPDLPVILHSNEPENRWRANSLGASFIDKNSPLLLQELGNFLRRDLGFGEFIFRMPSGEVVGIASNMKELEDLLRTVPDESIKYHAQRNHFSIWLMARGEFMLASELRPRKVEDFNTIEELRQDLISSLSKTRKESQKGIIAEFSCETFSGECNFNRIGTGSLGGKARGIAFINALLAQEMSKKIQNKYPDVEIKIPYTIVISTDQFDKFIRDNDLARPAVEEKDDKKIEQMFLRADIGDELRESLRAFLKYIDWPLAVRSSSLLEDSHAQPFAGIYSTYMLPNSHQEIDVRLEQLISAIKLTYASAYYQPAKAYLEATSNRIEEEKMGVIIQQVAGRKYDDLFYPDFSGVVRSVNFFPVSHMKHDDGIAYVALGLGKSIMEGQNTLQFSPKHPQILPQLSYGDFSIKNTQRDFYALNLKDKEPLLSMDEGSTLVKESISRAQKDGTLDAIGSVYDAENDIIKDGIHHQGLKFVSFAHILKDGVFPLSDLLNDVLEIGKTGLGSPVEIEFAVDLAKQKGQKHKFYFLQIRPMISGKELTEVEQLDVAHSKILCSSRHSLGNGVIKDLNDVVYIKTNGFDPANTRKIAEQIGAVNARLKNGAIFIGLGRWGTSDPWLGIPVNWGQISHVKVLVEAALENFNIDPSHGSHFFHNITSLGIGYLTIPANKYEEFIDWEWLDSQPAVYETEFVRHVYSSTPFDVILNGRKGIATILKP